MISISEPQLELFMSLFRRTDVYAFIKNKIQMKNKLLQSGNRELIEDSWRDSYWGWGPNKDGENYLGKLWMEVGEEFKKEA